MSAAPLFATPAEAALETEERIGDLVGLATVFFARSPSSPNNDCRQE
jgi:hypothetical protein